ncbi:Fic family protein (plasmid) [Macrococcoides bohemicum]|uniref:Fic/DOC family protein n=1 Tax=Macrococcoides bohemicum TaxID=1903056 RepID=UPI001C5FE551|nr:Fic family protein [Macrococcus bohemicus]QYA46056.1 Fic family protein [Macrococcus bohemicus]
MDKHTDKNNYILINNFNITNKEELKFKEQKIVSDAMEDLLDNDFKLSIKSSEDIKNIHKFLFGDVYPWAGEYRTTYIEKPEKVLNGFSVEYGNVNTIDESLNILLEEARLRNPNKMSPKKFVDHTRKLTADIWRVHPFREGNTRTAHVFASKYCSQYGYEFNDHLVSKNSQFFRDALVLANFYNNNHELLKEDEAHLKRMFEDAITETPFRKKMRIQNKSNQRDR